MKLFKEKMDSKMEFTATERGARKLLKDGYIYLF